MIALGRGVFSITRATFPLLPSSTSTTTTAMKRSSEGINKEEAVVGGEDKRKPAKVEMPLMTVRPGGAQQEEMVMMKAEDQKPLGEKLTPEQRVLALYKRIK